jgi:hypothetical protein
MTELPSQPAGVPNAKEYHKGRSNAAQKLLDTLNTILDDIGMCQTMLRLDLSEIHLDAKLTQVTLASHFKENGRIGNVCGNLSLHISRWVPTLRDLYASMDDSERRLLERKRFLLFSEDVFYSVCKEMESSRKLLLECQTIATEMGGYFSLSKESQPEEVLRYHGLLLYLSHRLEHILVILELLHPEIEYMIHSMNPKIGKRYADISYKKYKQTPQKS